MRVTERAILNPFCIKRHLRLQLWYDEEQLHDQYTDLREDLLRLMPGDFGELCTRAREFESKMKA